MGDGGRARVVERVDGDGARIPAAVFIDDVERFCAQNGAEETLRALSEAYNSFRMTLAQFARYLDGMEAKVPEIEKGLELIAHLRAAGAEPLHAQFPLVEGVFATARVADRSALFLWLGANLLVEYSLEEAEALLAGNLATARRNIETYRADIEYLKDQQTVVEVNMSRVHNHRTQAAKAAQS